MTGRLEGRSAVVTGATLGIGRAIAELFAAEGAFVVVADVIAATGDDRPPTAEAIAAAGGEAAFLACDVTRAADLERAVAAAVAARGRLDVMVNNAAIALGGRVHEVSEADWARVMAVNLTGMFLGCRAAIVRMLAQEPIAEARGRIVNVTSQHGMIAAPGDAAYGVSKAGGAQLTRQVAVDYAAELIVCNAVAPGKILTGSPSNAVDAASLAYARARTPAPRLGAPRDVAAAALFLASDEARHVTGATLMVDGGWMAA